MRLGDVLESWRIMHRLTQRQAADAIGITTATYGQIEAGRDINSKSLMATIVWLTGDEPEAAAPGQLALAPPERAANG